MDRPNQIQVIPALILGFIYLIHSQTATAADYSYNVDLCAVTEFDAGYNQTNFQIDNFDDNILSPWWEDNGTAEESSGVVTLKNPGTDQSLWEVLPAIGSELKVSGNRFDIIGATHANASSRWLTPTAPSLNQSYEMGLSIDFDTGGFVGDKITSFSVGIINLDASSAATLSTLMGVTVPAGLSGFFTRGIEDEEFGIETIELQIEPIADVLGNALLLGLVYDSEQNEVSARFSFDETATDFSTGVEVWEPFEAREVTQITDIIDSVEWDLTATSEVPIPGAVWLFCPGLLGLMGFKKIRNKA